MTGVARPSGTLQTLRSFPDTIVPMQNHHVLAAGFFCAILPAMGADAAHTYTAVRCGILLNVRSGRGIRDAMVLIADGKVRESGAAAQMRLEHNEHVVDLTHATCLPGLIDVHDHLTGDPS